MQCNASSLSNFVDDLLDAIYRLVESCHLPEFTDHGLPHLCSLIDRIDRWECPAGLSVRSTRLVNRLEESEAATLLVATLIHDLGMLSQNPIDLPSTISQQQSKGLWADVASWVRQTHVIRLDALVTRVMNTDEHCNFLNTQIFKNALEVAKSHQRWPWQWDGSWSKHARLRGLAAVLAVSDLLDEDSARCDTTTLLEHRQGNELNRAHWLRHALTSNRVLVVNGRILVNMVKPPDCDQRVLRPVYSALRNHFRLVMLYEQDLTTIDASITNVDLSPSTGIPDNVGHELAYWQRVDGFSTETALCFQLLRTFMPHALKDDQRCSQVEIAELQKVSLEDVDLSILQHSEGQSEPKTEFEMTFAALNYGEED